MTDTDTPLPTDPIPAAPPLTELRLAALSLWKHQRQELERGASRRAAELALDLFGDQAGPLADPSSWKGSADGDATAIATLDEDGDYSLEYDHTFDEQLWLRSGCPSCGDTACRVTPVGSVLELGQALEGLQEGYEKLERDGEVDADDLPGACDDCDGPNSPSERLYRAVVDAIEEVVEGDEDEDEDEDE
jgi:hypothetical protein